MKEFVELVAKMRQAQKEYFKTRTANWLLAEIGESYSTDPS